MVLQMLGVFNMMIPMDVLSHVISPMWELSGNWVTISSDMCEFKGGDFFTYPVEQRNVLSRGIFVISAMKKVVSDWVMP